METRSRSIVKAGLWTAIGLAMMGLTGALLTGSFQTGGLLAVLNAGLGLVSYFLYERLWARIRWGRKDA